MTRNGAQPYGDSERVASNAESQSPDDATPSGEGENSRIVSRRLAFDSYKMAATTMIVGYEEHSRQIWSGVVCRGSRI